jgi:hypothetical protein
LLAKTLVNGIGCFCACHHFFFPSNVLRSVLREPVPGTRGVQYLAKVSCQV